MALLSPLAVAAALLLLLAVRLARRLASPLRSLPGPPASLVTSLVLRWHEMRADRTMYIHRLHQRYGPVVRLAPDELSFSSPAAMREIYCSGGSGYQKSDFYSLFRVFGRRPMFATLGSADVSAPHSMPPPPPSC